MFIIQVAYWSAGSSYGRYIAYVWVALFQHFAVDALVLRFNVPTFEARFCVSLCMHLEASVNHFHWLGQARAAH